MKLSCVKAVCWNCHLLKLPPSEAVICWSYHLQKLSSLILAAITFTAPRPTTRAATTVLPTVVASTDQSGCGGAANLTGTSGEFSSGNYPNDYSKNSFCTWTITVKPSEVNGFSFWNIDFKMYYRIKLFFDSHDVLL